MADLKVILRPSQQYSAQPPSAQTSNISSSRLTSLAQSWTVLREQGIDFHDFLDAKKTSAEVDLTGEAGDIHFQFYRKSSDKSQEPAEPSQVESSLPATATPSATPTAGPSTVPPAAKPASAGMTTIHLPGVANSDKDAMAILADAVEKYDIPQDEKFELLCRIRISKALAKGHEEDRENLAVARLLAIAIYGTRSCCYYMSAEVLMSSSSSYSPREPGDEYAIPLRP